MSEAAGMREPGFTAALASPVPHPDFIIDLFVKVGIVIIGD